MDEKSRFRQVKSLAGSCGNRLTSEPAPFPFAGVPHAGSNGCWASTGFFLVQNPPEVKRPGGTWGRAQDNQLPKQPGPGRPGGRVGGGLSQLAMGGLALALVVKSDYTGRR